MDKNTFLLQLQKQLKGLPEEEVQQTVEYYREMLEDRIEEGLSEEEAVKEIGTVEEIAQPLLPKPTRNRTAWELVLLVLGFPVWFSVLAAVVGLFGVTLGAIGLLIHLSGLTSLGKDYLAPFSRGTAPGILRNKLKNQTHRPSQFDPEDRRNQK